MEDRNLAGDVEVVRAGLEARANHRVAGVDEGAGRVEHERDALERALQRGLVGQIERNGLEVELRRQGRGKRLGGRAPGEQRAMPPSHRLFGDQRAGVSVGPVNHPAGSLTHEICPSRHAPNISRALLPERNFAMYAAPRFRASLESPAITNASIS